MYKRFVLDIPPLAIYRVDEKGFSYPQAERTWKRSARLIRMVERGEVNAATTSLFDRIRAAGESIPRVGRLQREQYQWQVKHGFARHPLKELLRKLGATEEEFALTCNVSIGEIQAILDGTAPSTAPFFSQMTKAGFDGERLRRSYEFWCEAKHSAQQTPPDPLPLHVSPARRLRGSISETQWASKLGISLSYLRLVEAGEVERPAKFAEAVEAHRLVRSAEDFIADHQRWLDDRDDFR